MIYFAFFLDIYAQFNDTTHFHLCLCWIKFHNTFAAQRISNRIIRYLRIFKYIMVHQLLYIVCHNLKQSTYAVVHYLPWVAHSNYWGFSVFCCSRHRPAVSNRCPFSECLQLRSSCIRAGRVHSLRWCVGPGWAPRVPRQYSGRPNNRANYLIKIVRLLNVSDIKSRMAFKSHHFCDINKSTAYCFDF